MLLPEHIDIYVVRAMLSKAKNLPADVVDMIFDHAEYWVHSSNEIDYRVEHQEPLRVVGRSPAENKFVVSTCSSTADVANLDSFDRTPWV